MNNKSEIFERIVQFSVLKGFKNLNDFSNYVGFTSPEKLYRLGRSDSNKPSFNMLLQISNAFKDLNLNWLIKGSGPITLTDSLGEINLPKSTVENSTTAIADAVEHLIQGISEANTKTLHENMAALLQHMQNMAKNEKEIKERVDYIYNMLIKAELSKDIQKTIDKVKE